MPIIMTVYITKPILMSERILNTFSSSSEQAHEKILTRVKSKTSSKTKTIFSKKHSRTGPEKQSVQLNNKLEHDVFDQHTN